MDGCGSAGAHRHGLVEVLFERERESFDISGFEKMVAIDELAGFPNAGETVLCGPNLGARGFDDVEEQCRASLGLVEHLNAPAHLGLYIGEIAGRRAELRDQLARVRGLLLLAIQTAL